MASGFLALFDDIAVLLDDVASMSKMATEKTVGILGDDLAVNAEKASGFASTREIPVLWAITKGSLLNKLIILPFAFLLSAFAPWTIIPILLFGGLYLGFEGAEKIYEYFFHKKVDKKKKLSAKSEEEILDYEKKKVKSAIFVDFILSIEVIILSLSTVVESPLPVQIGVVTIIATMATIGVYGLVALIVRMDDLGYKLKKHKNIASQKFGSFLIAALPIVIRILTVLGTLAMLLVAGGIYLHNIHYLHDLFHSWPSLLAEFVIGLFVGGVALIIFTLFSKLFRKKAH